jgi:hypothetical protein
MARVDFSPGHDICPVCFLDRTVTDPSDRIATGIALGCVSAVVANSPLERGELVASACPQHQQRLSQLVYAFSQLSGVDYKVVFEKLGALPGAGPSPNTLIHLVNTGRPRTVCGQRSITDHWPDHERFVYPDKSHLVSCEDCRNSGKPS